MKSRHSRRWRAGSPDPRLLALTASAQWDNRAGFCRRTPKSAQANEIPYGSSGPDGHAGMWRWKCSRIGGIKVLHIPFRGAGHALNAILTDLCAGWSRRRATLKQRIRLRQDARAGNGARKRIASFTDLPNRQGLGYKMGVREFYIWAGDCWTQDALPRAIMTAAARGVAQDACVMSPEVIKTFETEQSFAYMERRNSQKLSKSTARACVATAVKRKSAPKKGESRGAHSALGTYCGCGRKAQSAHQTHVGGFCANR